MFVVQHLVETESGRTNVKNKQKKSAIVCIWELYDSLYVVFRELNRTKCSSITKK